MSQVPAGQRHPSADELRSHIGQWVLVIAGKVIGSAPTASEALGLLERSGLCRVDSIFYVPERPEEQP